MTCLPDFLKSFPKISESLKSSQNWYFPPPVSSSPWISPHTSAVLSALSTFSLTHSLSRSLSVMRWEWSVRLTQSFFITRSHNVCQAHTDNFPRNSPEALMHTGQSSPEPIERGPRRCCTSVSTPLNTGCAQLPDLCNGADSDLQEKRRWARRREFLTLSPFSFPARGHFWYGN